jgi:hypothetical protein
MATQEPAAFAMNEKMKMVFTTLPESYTNGMTQKQLNALLKLSTSALERKLDDLQLKLMMNALRGKIKTEPIK